MASDGGSDLRGVEFLAFDLAGLDYVLRESAQVSFAAQAKSQTFHFAEQPPLLTGGARRKWREAPLVPLRMSCGDSQGYSPHGKAESPLGMRS